MRDQRKLVYVPILHTYSDMGTLAGSMKETYVRKFGEKKWQEHVTVIDEMWQSIKTRIRDAGLPYERVKIYQDGLPVCGKEKEIIRDLAKKGSPNHRLVEWMMHRGATIMGTEDPHLLLAEYNYLKKILHSKNHGARERLSRAYERVSGALLRKRDQAIRDRIDVTLKRGETGVLFIGLLHRVDELLPPDVQVAYLIHRLPFRRSFEMEQVA